MLLYQAKFGEIDDAVRFEKLIASMAIQCGCSASYLAASLRRLPEGLLDTENELTLRRAANTACGVEEARAYTNFELQQATCAVLDGKSRASDVHAK